VSADNWAICPRCRRRAEAKKAELEEQVRVQYGQILIEDWDALRQEAEKPLDEMALTTFREDYEFYGVEEGVVFVSYGGSCKTCGLSLSISEQHPIPGVDE
jgi:hypothetical protein